MANRAPLLFSLLVFVCGLAGAPPPKASKAPTAAQRTHNASTSSSSVLLRGLTLRDRIAQMVIVRGYGDYPPPDNREYQKLEHAIRDLHVGGMIIANRVRDGQVINAQPFEMAAFLNHLQKLAHTPLIFASDFEHGASMRVAETARYPYFMAYGAAHDLAAVRELGAFTAREARALGITWVFAPDADVNNNPDNPIINIRSFGEDAQAVGEGVGAFIDGAHSDPQNYVMVAPKHFPGHGDTADDSHMQLPKIDQPKERIESLELVPFRAAILHKTDAIMSGHLAVPAFEPAPIPATVSKKILTDLLRQELGFTGLVVTDALDMQGVTALAGPTEAVVRAVEAGADVILMPVDPEAAIRGVERAVQNGRISEKRINESAARILAAKQKVGLFRNHSVNLDRIAAEIKDPTLDQAAQRVANEALTLTKDENHMFPLADAQDACAVVMAEGTYPTRGGVFLREIAARSPAVKQFIVNSAMGGDELDGVAKGMSSCKSIYAAAFVTVSAYRGSVTLEGGLNQFFETIMKSPASVALISLGNPYLLRYFPAVSSYMATFSPATSSESAAARAIFGEIPIQGRMPVSIPGFVKIGDGISVTVHGGKASQTTK